MVLELLPCVDLAEGTDKLDGVVVLVEAALEPNAVRMVPVTAVLTLYVLTEIVLAATDAVAFFFGWPANESLLNWLAL